MPVLGQLVLLKSGLPLSLRTMRPTASMLVGWPLSSGLRSRMVTRPPSLPWKATSEPWHCWQPELAGASPFTACTARPGVGECGLNGARAPSTVSARKLSSDARMLPAFEWWLAENSAASVGWHRAQSRGVTMVAICWP